MTPSHQITMLKFIKNLSMLSTTLESLHSADAIDFLIDVLGHSIRKGAQHFREISNQVLNTMFNLCRLSKERQEYAASNGIIPLLLKIMKTDRPPKEFVLPILCDMAHSGSKGRRYLWQNNGLDFYVSLLSDQYWQVTALDAIFVWLQEETAKVETHLLRGEFTTSIMSCFITTKVNAFDPNLLEPLLKVLRLSPSVAASLAKADMYAGIAQKLNHKKAVVRLNLLRLVRNIMDGCETNNSALASRSTSNTGQQLRLLFDDIQTLADKDAAVLVRNLASELVRSRFDTDLSHDVSVLSLAPGAGAGGSHSGPRSRSGPRRTTSYTAASLPPTPLGHRPSQSSAFIEVASTPKRTALAMTHERDASIYRPRSRDGTNLPRRVSGDTTAASSSLGPTSGNPAAGKSGSRLPRTSMTGYARPSLTSSVTAPPSSQSGRGGGGNEGKENQGRIRSGSSAVADIQTGGRIRSGSSTTGYAVSPSTTSAVAGFMSRETSVTSGSAKRRNSRAPSSDLRWS